MRTITDERAVEVDISGIGQTLIAVAFADLCDLRAVRVDHRRQMYLSRVQQLCYITVLFVVTQKQINQLNHYLSGSPFVAVEATDEPNFCHFCASYVRLTTDLEDQDFALLNRFADTLNKYY